MVPFGPLLAALAAIRVRAVPKSNTLTRAARKKKNASRS